MEATILAIDNEDVIREDIREFLIAQNLDFMQAETGEKGIAKIIDEQPDLIICNITLSDLDGFQVLEYIKNKPEISFTPFIFVTRKSSRKIYRQAMELGADDYLSLPFTKEELLKAIFARLPKKSAIANEASSKEQEDIDTLQEKLQNLSKKEQMQKQILDKLYEDLKSNLSKTKLAIYMLKNENHQQKQERYLKILEEECNWAMELLEKVSELRSLLTPNNLNFLERYEFLNKLNKE